jgi:phospho-N-acetylmuramoyl-pentapeptide-transferase
LIVIIVAVLFSFLWYNINPAKIFMWDSWAFALGGFLSSLILLLNMREWIFIPFVILFGLFIIELLSSFIQIFSKKYFHKKIFAIAPFHHLCEYYGMKEYTVVMKFWMIQWLLALVSIILILYLESFNTLLL